MSSRPVYELRAATVRTAAALPRFCSASLVSIRESPAIEVVECQPRRSQADALGCIRGVRAAFVLEGGMALLLYGSWYLWHLVH